MLVQRRSGLHLVHSSGVDYRFKEAYSAAKMILEGAPGAGAAASLGLHLGCAQLRRGLPLQGGPLRRQDDPRGCA